MEVTSTPAVAWEKPLHDVRLHRAIDHALIDAVQSPGGGRLRVVEDDPLARAGCREASRGWSCRVEGEARKRRNRVPGGEGR
jgi:hypothetical protein